MRQFITILRFSICIFLIPVIAPETSLGRNNILTTGIGVSFDYFDRTNERLDEVDDLLISNAEDDYNALIIRPLIQVISTTARDNIELRFQPDLRHDLSNDETDWNSNARISADRFMSREWQLGLSYRYLVRDYYERGSEFQDATTAIDQSQPVEDSPATSQELSPDNGRRRYTQNFFWLFSDYFYRDDSLIRIATTGDFLRYDNNPAIRQEDYDRYELNFVNEHRFDAIWNTLLDLRFIRGDFEPTDPVVANAIVDEIAPDTDIPPFDEELSNDLKEYRVLFTGENNSINKNPLYLDYNYIGTDYDEILRTDGDIHQMRFTWRRDFSPRLYTRLGAGPSYEKSEGRDGRWESNGIAAINYTFQNGDIFFVAEKRLDVENFSGNSERGLVKFWDAQLGMNYLLTRNLGLNARISYLSEDREDPLEALGTVIATDTPLEILEDDDIRQQLEEYHNDRYFAGVGLNYTFLQHYSARVDYSFNKLESDRIGDDYYDHRLLLTLSWQKDTFRW